MTVEVRQAPDDSGDMSDGVPGGVSGSVPASVPGGAPARVSSGVPGGAPARVSSGVPGGAPVGMPARLGRLEGLAEVLAGRGLRARLMTPPGRVPRLHVVNPAAAALAEDIYVGRGQDGQWWFWWSWAERIASSQDLTAAATQIGRVLAARDGPPAA